MASMRNMSYDLLLRGAVSQKQTQRLIVSKEMALALKLLQLPTLELNVAIEEELETNPLLERSSDPVAEEEVEQEKEEVEIKELEIDENHFEILKHLEEEFSDLMLDPPKPARTQADDKKQAYLESSVIDEPSLYEQLLSQAHENLDEEDVAIAQVLIGELDERGWMTTPLEELKELFGYSVEELTRILKVIQTFEPAGIGSQSLQDSLLLQLERQNKRGSLAYQIVLHHFDDLIRNKIPAIQKGLQMPSQKIVEEIKNTLSKLDIHPGLSISKTTAPYLTPDVLIEEVDGELKVSLPFEALPSLRLSPRYLKMLKQENLPADTKKFIEEKTRSAKWLIRTLLERATTIEKIASVLANKNREFFLNPQGQIKPLTMKELALLLELHESTVGRAVMNKYVASSRGILPLRSFFSSTFTTEEGEKISSKSVKDVLRQLIDQEDKMHPLSDDALSKIIQAKGIPCARRTVAKFRSQLEIGNTKQRRKY